MTPARIHVVRSLLWHYLNLSTANAVGLTVHQLQQFIAGKFMPSDEQLTALARRMRLEDSGDTTEEGAAMNDIKTGTDALRAAIREGRSRRMGE
jgi:hypothetical protein